MNRDQIRLLAQEAGFTPSRDERLFQEMIERFAHLVIAHHRETIVGRAKSYMAHERSAAVHHFNRWHQASEYHLTRYSGMDDLLDVVLSKQ